MNYDADTRTAASRRYQALDTLTLREINAAAEDLLKRSDWRVWSLLTSSPERRQRLRDARYAAFLAWERQTQG